MQCEAVNGFTGKTLLLKHRTVNTEYPEYAFLRMVKLVFTKWSLQESGAWAAWSKAESITRHNSQYPKWTVNGSKTERFLSDQSRNKPTTGKSLNTKNLIYTIWFRRRLYSVIMERIWTKVQTRWHWLLGLTCEMQMVYNLLCFSEAWGYGGRIATR